MPPLTSSPPLLSRLYLSVLCNKIIKEDSALHCGRQRSPQTLETRIPLLHREAVIPPYRLSTVSRQDNQVEPRREQKPDSSAGFDVMRLVYAGGLLLALTRRKLGSTWCVGGFQTLNILVDGTDAKMPPTISDSLVVLHFNSSYSSNGSCLGLTTSSCLKGKTLSVVLSLKPCHCVDHVPPMSS